MKLDPKTGIGPFIFGMKRPDVEKLSGKPDKSFSDEEENVIWLYHDTRCRLTFYADEDFRLGYIICAHPELEFGGNRLIGQNLGNAKAALSKIGGKWESESFDMTDNHFNEENWLILQSEFGAVTKVELGVVAKNLDDFDWKF